MNHAVIAHHIKSNVERIHNIKNIIAITSGKGGVGKSTTAINLALSLAKLNLRIGVLDADIYGPSLPILIGAQEFKPEVSNNKFVPLSKYNIKAMSFGFLINAAQPAIWRGSIVTKALTQLLYDSQWGELDILLIDMPPGTGDIHLTMCQKMPITANVIVTTPQDIALLDVVKSVEMYQKLSIPCIGIIENMSTHTCSNCGHSEAIFGANGGEDLAHQYSLPLLGKLPLNVEIRTQSDQGEPVSLTNNALAALYSNITDKLLAHLAQLPPDDSVAVKAAIQNIIDEVN